jgi:hypothetical protein
MSINCLRISFEEDLNLHLYRHWTVYDSIIHSPVTACQFKVWKLKGQSLLHEFLAAIGLPLVQCKQKYNSMDYAVRGEGRFQDQADEESMVAMRLSSSPNFEAMEAIDTHLLLVGSASQERAIMI